MHYCRIAGTGGAWDNWDNTWDNAGPKKLQENLCRHVDTVCAKLWYNKVRAYNISGLAVRGLAVDQIVQPELSGKWVAGFLYIVVSVLLEYWPRFARWWDSVEDKPLWIALAGAVVVAGLVGLNYAGAFGWELPPFGWEVVGEALKVWIAFLGGNWAVWNLARRAAPMPRKRAPTIEYLIEAE